MNAPSEQNDFLWSQVRHLLHSYQRFLGQPLIDATGLTESEIAQRLYEAPFAVVSHGTQADPIFNYANRCALDLFAMNWDEFTALPSRYSAEAMNREERASMLARVTQHNYIDDYRGVRIAKSGARFEITDATIWNLFDGDVYVGQAAVLRKWRML